MIRSAADVIAIAKERGFEVKVNPGPPPTPFLRGDPKNATPALLDALRAFRLEIIEEVSKEPKRLRVWMWKHGTTQREIGEGFPSEFHPEGAVWFYFADERRWRLTPFGETSTDRLPPAEAAGYFKE